MGIEVEVGVGVWWAGVVVGDDFGEGGVLCCDAAAEVGEPGEFVVLVGEAFHDGGVELFDAFDGDLFVESAEGLEGDGACGDAVCVDVGDDVDGACFGDGVCKLVATLCELSSHSNWSIPAGFYWCSCMVVWRVCFSSFCRFRGVSIVGEGGFLWVSPGWVFGN